MAVLLRCIIELSKTLDTLAKTGADATAEEDKIFYDIKSVFMSLCELQLEADGNVNPNYDSSIARKLFVR
jgi:hypothetical protein